MIQHVLLALFTHRSRCGNDPHRYQIIDPITVAILSLTGVATLGLHQYHRVTFLGV